MDSTVCSVCISALVEELCVPCSNNHKFHRACLLEWATTLHTCPMCREDFEEIKVYDKEGKVLETIKAPAPNKDKHRELHDVVFDPPYSNMACELCHALTDEDQMILCDICDLGFHIYCLRPPLSSIPSGRWECERCRPGTSSITFGGGHHPIVTIENSPTNRHSDPFLDGFINDVEDENGDENMSDGEIVSSEDEESGSTSHHDEQQELFDDDEVLGNGQDLSDIPSTSHSTLTMKDLKKGRTKKKFSRRKKSRKSCTKSSDPTKPRKKSSRRKRGSKRKCKSKKRGHKKTPPEDGETARNRIADVCGIDLKHSDKYKVVKKGGSRDQTSSSSSSSKLVIADRKLDLLGQKWVLPPDSDGVSPVESQKPSTSAAVNVEEKRKSNSPQFRGTLSLLDEIMANQSKVLAPSNLLKINRDGSLGETDDYKKYLEKRDRKREKEESDRKEAIKAKEAKKSPPTDQPTVENNGRQKLAKDGPKDAKKSPQHKMENRKLKPEKDSTEQNSVKLVKQDIMAAPACRGKDSTIEPSSSGATTNSASNTKRSRWQPVADNKSSGISDRNPSFSKSSNTNSESTKYAKNHNNNHSHNIPPLKQCANPAVHTNPFEFLLQQHSAANFPNPINFNPHNIDPLRSLQANPAVMQQILAGAFPSVSSGSNGLLQNMQSLMTSSASTQSIMESAVAAMNASNKLNVSNINIPTSMGSGLLSSNSLFDLINGTNTGPGPANSLLQPSYSHLNNLGGSNSTTNLSTMEIIAQLFNNQPSTLPAINPLFLRPTIPQPAPSLVQKPAKQEKPSILATPPPPRQEYKKLAPPPPPPTAPEYGVQSSASRMPANLMDSPMDIDMDDEDEPSNSTTLNGSDGDKKASKESRSATVKLADAAMKAALKPYFAKRLISKDEYKDIMKKGVSKLRNCESLKQAKVDRFVKQYVDVAISKRTRSK